jgi:predicted outer membrane repeat protein
MLIDTGGTRRKHLRDRPPAKDAKSIKMNIHITFPNRKQLPPISWHKYLGGVIVLFLLCLPGLARAQQIVRIPADQPNLQQAIGAVADGGIIEFAAGTYSAPSGGFTIYDLPSPKAFTVRAAAGAAVTLTGNGSTDILRFAPSSFSAARPVTFQGITFANGLSRDAFIGGGMTLVHCEVSFVSCTFQNNAANTPLTGGGAQWIDSSIVSFQGCTWTGNNSPNYGGAMSVFNSRVYVQGCRFTGNRVNLPGHRNNSSGGAVFVSSSATGQVFTRTTLQIANCTFENNQAGYVGGALYTLGEYENPADVPTVDLLVTNSVFNNNLALRDPSVAGNGPTAGGAFHLEDQTTAKFQNCRFTNNSARQGGAISSYRATTDFQGCTFRGNQATGTGFDEGIGGTIIALSSDNPDSSTNFGKINRPSVVLTMTDSLIQGMPGVISGREGGGILAAGDFNAPAVPGSPDFNRATVNLTRVVLADLSVASAGGTPGTGGGLKGDFMILTMDNSIVENCTAAAYGGGFNFNRLCKVTVSNSTIANNDAGSLGGGIAMFGGTLNLSNSNLVGNRITGSGDGSALTTSPAMEMTGLVQNCVLSSNSGGATIYDGDSANAPFNQLQYSSNQIFPGDTTAFLSDAVGGQTAAQLNNLKITRSDRSVTTKAPIPNSVPSGSPALGALLIVPPTVLSSGGPGEVLPIAPVLAYASSGGTPNLDGSAQRAASGVVGPVAGSGHTLLAGGSSYSTTPPSGVAANISTRLALGAGEQVLIGGFIIQGPSPKRVIIRGTGPSLPGVTGALKDPYLELHDATSTLATNNNWRTTNIGGIIQSNQSIDIIATTVAPSNDAEAAIVVTLNPGSYTAVLRGADGGTGIGLMEIYDLDALPNSRLANISTRGLVQTLDNVMIGGFIIVGGNNNTTVVIRALGPSLTAFGISGALPDPVLEVHDANGGVTINDDWGQGPNAADIQAKGLAPGNPAESALLLSGLPPGPYTAIVRGKNTIGVGLVEVYQLQ